MSLVLVSIIILFGIFIFTKIFGNKKNECNTCESGCETCVKHLINTDNKPQITYFDDEELDAFQGISPNDYTPQQIEQFEYILKTMNEKDVKLWLISLRQRKINIPKIINEKIKKLISIGNKI